MDIFAARRAMLLGHARADGVDGYLLSHPASVNYFSGWDWHGDWLLIAPSGAQLVVGEGSPAHEAPPRACEVQAVSPGGSVEQAAAVAADRAGSKVIAIESEHLPVAALGRLAELMRKAKPKPVPGRVESLRAVKDQAEVEAIRSAARVTERAMVMLQSLLREQDTEKDLADALEMYIRRAGGRGSAFPSVVALGAAGAGPQRPSPDRLLIDASKVLVGCGADVGYRCELWQAFRSPFGSSPTRKTQRERTGHDFDRVSRAVRDAFDAALSATAPGVALRAIVAAAREVLKGAGFEGHTPSVLGQGVGLEVREGPVLHPKAEGTVQAGMVLTLAPAVLIAEWGGVRYGGPVLVKRDGGVPLFNPDSLG